MSTALMPWRCGGMDTIRHCESDNVREAISKFPFSWANFYHLSADALNRILDEKERILKF